MRRRHSFFRASRFALLPAALLTTGLAFAQVPTKETPPPQPEGGISVHRAEWNFLEQAAQNSAMALAAAQLAVEKSPSVQVKAYAREMATEHQTLMQDVQAVGKKKTMNLPDSASLLQRGELQLLKAADGADFDKRYVEQYALKANEDTLKIFRRGETESQEPAVKALAARWVPKIEANLAKGKMLMPGTVAVR